MCGIAGFLYADRGRPADRALLQAMGDSLAHRGPDAEGFLEEPGVGLVHRRLSIIDPAGGDQPIRDADKLVFGSELKALLAHPGVPRAVDLEALEGYLAFGMVPGPRSIFQGIH